MMHFHRFGKWEDVKLSDKIETALPMFIWARQIITQQRRCSVCNMVVTRTT